MNHLQFLRSLNGEALALEESRYQALTELTALGTNITEAQVAEALGMSERRRDGEIEPGRNGVAVLPLFGFISQRSRYFGTSVERFRGMLHSAVANPDVKTIVIHCDSPGGVVSGVPELAADVYAARKAKRIIAVVDPLCASAAYWIATAAHQVVMTPSGAAGSIGVFLLHFDWSQALENEGIRVTLIRAGKYKAEGHPYEELSSEAEAHMQETVDDYYGMFTRSVSRHMGVGIAEVRKGFGEGRTLTAKRALDAGMIHRVATFEKVLSELGVASSARSASTAAGAVVDVTSLAPDQRPPEARETPVEDTTAAPEGAVATQDTPAAAPAPAAPAAVTHDPLAAERVRATKIRELCKEHGMEGRAERLIESGANPDQVAAFILAETRDGTAAPTTPSAPDISERERRPYSIARAMLALDRESRDVDAGYEREVSQELARRLGVTPQGMLISTTLGHGRPQAAGLDAHTATAGTELVFTEPGSFIELLRNRAMVLQLGAQLLPGLHGNVSMPRQNGAGTATWVGENPGSDVADSDLTTDNVTLSPKTLQSTTSFSRQLLAQANIDTESLVRQDLAALHALAIDLAALIGSGASNQPTGITSTTGVGSVAIGTNGGAPTYAHIVDLESEITQDNADIGTMAYLTTPVMRGKLKQTEIFSGSNGRPVWTGSVSEGEMNGYRAAASGQVPSALTKGSSTDCHAIFFAMWNALMIGEWGAFDIIVDPYALKKQGMIEVTSFQMVDIALRRPEHFAVIEDARNV